MTKKIELPKREIKFRVWDKRDKRMRDIGYLDFEGRVQILENDHPSKVRNKKDFVLMQYTGLKDKNGTEIYEGDIVKYRPYYAYEYNEEYEIDIVKWGETGDTDGFLHHRHLEWIVFDQPLADVVDGDCEVIGNIFEDSELLKENL